MPAEASLLILILWLGVVGLFTAREVWLYRHDQKTRTDIYPYTRKRLLRRLVISLLIVLEGILLFPGQHALSGTRPTRFILYVAAVGLLALLMVLLAFLDLRESRELQKTSERQLLQEFIQELQQDKNPPAAH